MLINFYKEGYKPVKTISTDYWRYENWTMWPEIYAPVECIIGREKYRMIRIYNTGELLGCKQWFNKEKQYFEEKDLFIINQNRLFIQKTHQYNRKHKFKGGYTGSYTTLEFYQM